MALKNTFAKNGYRYKLLKRNENFAIYLQEKEGFTYQYYEVIVIQKTRIDKNTHWGFVRAGTEFYPSTEQWGQSGWTYKTLEQALSKFDQLTANLKIPQKEPF